MSRVGKQPLILPPDIIFKHQDGEVRVEGKKGILSLRLPLGFILTEVAQGSWILGVNNEDDQSLRPLWGLYRRLLSNLVIGVTTGFEKKLELVGVGFKASVKGTTLSLSVGYSHPSDYSLPEGITAVVENNIITIRGVEKQRVGEVVAQIRRIRRPEPYKGKGIRYFGEVIKMKAGKSAKTAA